MLVTAHLHQILKKSLFEKEYKIYPNPFSDEIFVENLLGDEHFIIYDFLGQNITEGKCSGTIKIPEINSGIYYLIKSRIKISWIKTYVRYFQ